MKYNSYSIILLVLIQLYSCLCYVTHKINSFSYRLKVSQQLYSNNLPNNNDEDIDISDFNKNHPAKSIFIFGLGYVGTAVAYTLKEKGWKVSGTCTNVNKAIEFRNQGISAYPFYEGVSREDIKSDCLNDILESNCILSTIPPLDQDVDIVLKEYKDIFCKSVLDGNLKWIGYCSSTGVYGDMNGAWVTEKDLIQPSTYKTQLRATTEMLWKNLYTRHGLPVHIFRLAGIYGPQRNALETLIQANGDLSQCAVNDIEYTSRIHVYDIVTCLQASMAHPTPNDCIYNLCDDAPSTKYEVMTYACKLLSYPRQPPPTTTLENLSTSSAARNAGNTRNGSKRVDNSKIRALLQQASMDFTYPDYKKGLLSLVNGDFRPFSYKFNSSIQKNNSIIDRVNQQNKSKEDLKSEVKESIDQSNIQDEVKILYDQFEKLTNRMQTIEENQKSIMAALIQITNSIKK